MRLFVNIPFPDLEKYAGKLAHYQVGPEIYLPSQVIKTLKRSHVVRAKKLLKSYGLSCTVHAPYLDLNLGALDGDVLSISRRRIERAVEVAVELEAQRCVIHSFYDDYRYDFHVKMWLEVMGESIERVLNLREGSDTLIVIENVFDRNPDALFMLFKKFKGRLWMCFDPAHANLFSEVSFKVWLEKLGRFMRHMHMHDNAGKRDEHLPPGRGTVPYSTTLSNLALRSDLTVTVEPHRLSHVKPMIEFALKWFGGMP